MHDNDNTFSGSLADTTRRVRRWTFEDLPIAAIEFSRGVAIASSREWEVLTGLDRVSSAGIGWLDALHPDDRALAVGISTSYGSESSHHDVRLVAGDGQTVRMHVRVRSLDNDEPDRRLATFTEIGTVRADQSQLWQLATRDSLTGLLNRTAFHAQALADLERDGPGTSAIFYIDLDHFKQVNDELGHRFGDLLLVAVARRLQAAVRADDVIGRFGGDELCVWCPMPGSRADATAIAQRVVEAFNEPFHLDGEMVVMDASVGVAFAIDASANLGQLIHVADRAMYQAKAAGGARWCSLTSTTATSAPRTSPPLVEMAVPLAALHRRALLMHHDAVRGGDHELAARLAVIRRSLIRPIVLAGAESDIDVVDDLSTSSAKGIAGLEHAVDARITIAQAQGVIAASQHLDLDEAAVVLTQLADGDVGRLAATAATVIERCLADQKETNPSE